LHLKGHVVGFLGDGINDSPALKAADVGVSVDTAVDIAKESADIILLEKSLMVLQDGVDRGAQDFRQHHQVHWLRSFVTGGGLISYGPDNSDLYRRAAGYVDRILKGQTPRTCRCKRQPNTSLSSTSRPPLMIRRVKKTFTWPLGCVVVVRMSGSLESVSAGVRLFGLSASHSHREAKRRDRREARR
jgi:hypothetical protein